MTFQQPEQLSLFSHGLSPLQLNARVWVHTEGYEGVVAQIWEDHDHYAVYTTPWRTPMDKGLPIYRRDELELLPTLESDL